jgi:DNA repair exonuclease SbcCD nuclease subunit
MPLRILVLADTHLGFDLPVRPRVRRRRRGHDFLDNYRRALAPALEGSVDLVVHGGDVFHRARVPPSLVYQAFEPLREVADRGIPVFVVPGNHERSRIPHRHLARHARIHVFDEPATGRLAIRGRRIAVCGFPYERGGVRHRFVELLRRTGWQPGEADVSILCLHHCFEGATVGPADYTFRNAPDVIRGRDVPPGLAAVLTGHVHRHQVLTRDLSGRPMGAPVFYPGSVERTAFAEKDESKGYVVLDVDGGGAGRGGRVVGWRFRELPARPMVVREIDLEGLAGVGAERLVRRALAEAPANAVVRLRVRGAREGNARDTLAAARLRGLAPPSMNVEVLFADQPPQLRRRSPRDEAPPPPSGALLSSPRRGSGRTGRSAAR